MRDLLTAYPSLVRSAALVAVTYRGRIILGVITGFFPLLTMAVWLTVVAEAGPPAGWTTGDFLSYYAAATLLWNLSGDHVVWQWDADMRSGDLSVRLLRPVHRFHQYATSSLGNRLVFLTVLAPALTIGALLTPGLDYPADPVRLAAVAPRSFSRTRSACSWHRPSPWSDSGAPRRPTRGCSGGASARSPPAGSHPWP